MAGSRKPKCCESIRFRSQTLLLSTCICEVGWGCEEAKGWGWYYLPVFARLDEVEKRLKDEAEYPDIAEYSQKNNQQFDGIYQHPEQ